MVTNQNSEGPTRAAAAVIVAVTRHAYQQAHLAIAFLKHFGLCDDGQVGLPIRFLIELTAVLRLGIWERNGLYSLLGSKLPSYREAMGQLLERCKKGRYEFEGPAATPLYAQVLLVWVRQFAWDGPELLQADVLVGDPDEDELIDLLAQFVWTHRNDLQHIVRGDNSDEKT
jgi:hypothetical protein